MSELTPDKKLLLHLSTFGTGNYQNVSGFIIQLFPVQYQTDFAEYLENIDFFLGELKRHNYLDYKIIEPGSGVLTINAAITKEGVQFINPIEKETISPSTQIFGDNNIINQSSSNVSINKDTQKQSPAKPTSISKILKIIGLIIGIFISFFAVIKGCKEVFPDVNSPQTDSLKKDSVSKLPIDTTTRKTDTHTIPKPPFQSKQKESESKKVKDNPISIENNSGIVNFGDNTTIQQVNPPQPQRHLSLTDKVFFDNSPVKQKEFSISVYHSDPESLNYANEIRAYLESKGYNMFATPILTRFMEVPPEKFGHVDAGLTPDSMFMLIVVYPLH